MRAVFALLVLASAAQAQFDMCQFIPQCTISQCSEPFTVRGGSDSACTSYDGVIESWSNILPQFEKCGRDWSQFWCNLIEAYFDDFEGSQCQMDESTSLAPCKESCEDIMWDCTNDDFWVEHMCSGFRSEGSGLCYPMAMDNDDDPEDGDEEFPDGPDLPDFPGGFPDLDGGIPLRQSATVQKKPTSRRDCSEVASTFCPMIYAPVCGSDGITYGNTCEFGKAQCFNPGLAVSFNGACEDSALPEEPAVNCDEIGCPAVWAPVCGSDMHTYSNACEFGRAQCKDASLTVSFTGECPEPVQHQEQPEGRDCDDIMCPMVWAPVCGSDLHTYGNECEFGRAQCKDASLSVSFTGECPEMQHQQQQQEVRDCDDIMCPMVWAPVCGSDMHTYGNDCEFGRAQCKDASLSMSFTGECPETEPAPMCEEIVCPKILDPVCASDGITYSNPCILSIAQCRDPTLAVAFMGECEGVLGGIAGAVEDESESTEEDRPRCVDCLDMFEAGHASCQAFETNCLSTGGQSCSFRAMRCIRDIDETVRACSAECIAN